MKTQDKAGWPMLLRSQPVYIAFSCRSRITREQVEEKHSVQGGLWVINTAASGGAGGGKDADSEDVHFPERLLMESRVVLVPRVSVRACMCMCAL